MGRLPETIIPVEQLQDFDDADFAQHEGSLVFRRKRRLREEAWNLALAEHSSASPLQYLEVGSQEGSASIWFLENKLGHPDSRFTAVDVFSDNAHHTLEHNLKQGDWRHKVDVHRGKSGEVLRTLPLYTYDAIYIDGLHASYGVIEDAVLAWRLLKTGGIMMFDDYPWDQRPGKFDVPKPAIDIFLMFFEGKYELLDIGWILSLRKTQDTDAVETYATKAPSPFQIEPSQA